MFRIIKKGELVAYAELLVHYKVHYICLFMHLIAIVIVTNTFHSKYLELLSENVFALVNGTSNIIWFADFRAIYGASYLFSPLAAILGIIFLPVELYYTSLRRSVFYKFYVPLIIIFGGGLLFSMCTYYGETLENPGGGNGYLTIIDRLYYTQFGRYIYGFTFIILPAWMLGGGISYLISMIFGRFYLFFRDTENADAIGVRS